MANRRSLSIITARHRLFAPVLTACGLMCLLLVALPSPSMGHLLVTEYRQTPNTDQNRSEGSVQVTIELIGENGIAQNPADIVLVLDRSGSMESQVNDTEKIVILKNVVSQFVQIFDHGVDGLTDGDFIPSRIGVVSFSGESRIDTPLVSTTADILSATGVLEPGGSTAIGSGISAAHSLLAESESQRFIILVTDGEEQEQSKPIDAATKAKEDSITIFTIGFDTAESKAENILLRCASGPDTAFLAYTSADLEEVFSKIHTTVIQPLARNLVLEDIVDDQYLVQNAKVDTGSVVSHDNVVTWTLETFETGRVTLTYTAVPIQPRRATFSEVRTSVTYSEGTCSELSSKWFPDQVLTVVRFHSKDQCADPG